LGINNYNIIIIININNYNSNAAILLSITI